MDIEPEEIHEEFRVVVGVDKKTGTRMSEVWRNLDGEIHNPHGLPAIRNWYSDDGALFSEEYLVRGVRHRDGDDPAEIYYDHKTGKPTEKVWYKNGIETRSGGLPSTVKINPRTDVVVHERYTDETGKLHREGDQPAVVHRYPQTGEIAEVEYYVHGGKQPNISTPSIDFEP